MSSYMIRGLPPGLIARVKARARSEDARLDDILIRALTTYAAGKTSHQLGVEGGKARAAKLTAEERQAIARQGGKARWKGRRHTNENER